ELYLSGGTDAFTLTQATSLPIETFEFSTDANGNIDGWAIQLATDSGPDGGCTAQDFVCPGTYRNQNGAGDYSAYDFNSGTPNEATAQGPTAARLEVGHWLSPRNHLRSSCWVQACSAFLPGDQGSASWNDRFWLSGLLRTT